MLQRQHNYGSKAERFPCFKLEIFFHGTVYNTSMLEDFQVDPPLSTRGLEQAQHLANHVAPMLHK